MGYQFDRGLMAENIKAQKKQLQASTAATWATWMDRVDQSAQDVKESEIAERDAIRTYEASTVANAKASERHRALMNLVARTKEDFQAFGPKMDAEQIEASSQARRQDRRTAAKERYANAREQADKAEKLSAAAVKEERRASLKMMAAYSTTKNMIDSYW